MVHTCAWNPGDDYCALLSLSLFTYVDNANIIADAQVRGRVTKLHVQLLKIYRDVHTPQWWSVDQLQVLDDALGACVEDFRYFQSIIQVDQQRPHALQKQAKALGHLFNIPKVHDFLCLGKVIRDIGCVMQGCTGLVFSIAVPRPPWRHT